MIIPFIPAKDFNLSKEFYQRLGFSVGEEFEDGTKFIECNYLDNFFILQDLWIEQWAQNTMLIVETESLEETLQKVDEFFKDHPKSNIKIKGPFEGNYGRQLHLIDPSGVLWHVFEQKEES